MKILAALFYALAVAGGSGALLNSFMLAFCVFMGVLFTLLAIERIVQDAVRPVRSGWSTEALYSAGAAGGAVAEGPGGAAGKTECDGPSGAAGGST